MDAFEQDRIQLHIRLLVDSTTDWAQCMWCESSQTCSVTNATAASWLGPSDDVMKNLFPGDGMCVDWRYAQCAMPGRFVILSVVGGLLLCILCCIGICICCACRSCRKRSKRVGYSGINSSAGDGVPLLDDQS